MDKTELKKSLKFLTVKEGNFQGKMGGEKTAAQFSCAKCGKLYRIAFYTPVAAREWELEAEGKDCWWFTGKTCGQQGG